MNPRALGLVSALIVLSVAAWAVDTHDTFEIPTTMPVGITGGDTPNEYSVSCASATSSGVATRLRPAVTDRSRRRLCVQNQGGSQVVFGTSTIAASNFWFLGESTNSAISPVFCSNSSGAWYCSAKAGSTAQTVIVLEETQSIP